MLNLDVWLNQQLREQLWKGRAVVSAYLSADHPSHGRYGLHGRHAPRRGGLAASRRKTLVGRLPN
jgi:hypothetical protein